MEERHKNAEEVMWKFARVFGIGEKDEDNFEVQKAMKELEKEDIETKIPTKKDSKKNEKKEEFVQKSKEELKVKSKLKK